MVTKDYIWGLHCIVFQILKYSPKGKNSRKPQINRLFTVTINSSEDCTNNLSQYGNNSLSN